MISEQVIRPNVSLFGRFQVKIGQGNENPIKWRTSKTEELMAYLIHQRGKPVDRDQILESLWGDVDIERAKKQFNTTVYYLRKNLGTIGLEGIVQNVKGHYIIQMSRLECDIDAFYQLVSAGIPNHSRNIKDYADKLENIYQTGYLKTNDYLWAEPTRSLLDSEYSRILLEIYEHYVQELEFSSAVNVLKKIVASHPLNEDFHVKLIQVYMLAGDRLSAKKQYDVLKHLLQTELGVEPTECVKQMLR
jgi:LuxR family maltose regulon positive regulatory protein